MTTMSTHSIPVELMEILNRIADNVNEVKERLARLEGQELTHSIRNLQEQVDKERAERVSLQIEVASVKTKLAPVIVGISMVGAVIIQLFATHLHL